MVWWSRGGRRGKAASVAPQALVHSRRLEVWRLDKWGDKNRKGTKGVERRDRLSFATFGKGGLLGSTVQDLEVGDY